MFLGTEDLGLSNHRLRSGTEVRHACRKGDYRGPTAGIAPGYVQGNLAILPQAQAQDFLRFCQVNPKPCPIIGMSEAGSHEISSVAADLDIRRDLPGYRVWKKGQLAFETGDVMEFWREDLVSFVIGCSFSFEEALLDDGLSIRHIELGRNVPMYRTNLPCKASGPFAGPMVVSMRPFKASHAIRAIQITSRFPSVHGAPIHLGDPQLIGIKDLEKPDYGDAVPVQPDEIPVFWACGVTPQAIIEAARLEFAITHAPGHMLVTDLKNKQLAIF